MRKLFAVVAGLLLAGGARAAWLEGSSTHFVVYANDSEANVRKQLDRLERFDRAVHVLRQIPEKPRGFGGRVTVYTVEDAGAIVALIKRSNVLAFYEPKLSGAVAFVPKSISSEGAASPLQVLFHEYSHHIMFADWPGGALPKWYIEGFAEFQSTPLFRPDGSVTFGSPPQMRTHSVGRQDLMPLKLLLQPNPRDLTDRQVDALYGRGWLFIDYLEADPGRIKQLGQYIDALDHGKNWQDAARVFGDLDRLDNVISTFGAQHGLPPFTVDGNLINVGEIKVRVLGPGEAATMTARIAVNGDVTHSMAARTVLTARQEAAPYPNDPAAQIVLAQAEFAAGNFEAAHNAALVALAADPKAVQAMLWSGKALQALAVQRKSKDTAEWQAVRHWYLEANKIEPENPEALANFYRSFLAAGQKPSKNAEEAMLYAAALAPYATDARVLAGRIYLERGNATDARAQLQPIVNSAEGSEELSKHIGEVIEALDTGGAGAALAKLNSKPEKSDGSEKGG